MYYPSKEEVDEQIAKTELLISFLEERINRKDTTDIAREIDNMFEESTMSMGMKLRNLCIEPIERSLKTKINKELNYENFNSRR